MTRELPPEDEAPRQEAPPGTVGYWTKHDRWAALGREVAKLHDEAKRRGVPIDSLPGAWTLIAAFKDARQKLGRGAL
jgi:hypothetical protein